MPYSHLILCRPLFLLPSIPPSIRVFSKSTLRMTWPKYWSFSFSIIPSKEIPGLISFRMDWLDLLVVQGTLQSLLQHHNSKASILQCSAPPLRPRAASIGDSCPGTFRKVQQHQNAAEEAVFLKVRAELELEAAEESSSFLPFVPPFLLPPSLTPSLLSSTSHFIFLCGTYYLLTHHTVYLSIVFLLF